MGDTVTIGRRDRLFPLVVGLAGLGAGAATAAVGNVVLMVHVVVAAVVLTYAVSSDAATTRQLPAVIRPASILAVTCTVSSLAAIGLDRASYASYISLWTAQGLGLLLGILLDRFVPPSRRGRAVVDGSRVRRIAWAVWGIGVLTAGAFFAVRGVPALGADVEQGRVDAAVSGTGYLRLLGYLSGPAALALFATKARWARSALVVAGTVILLLANRSPLLYLVVPLSLIIFLNRPASFRSARIVGAVLAAGLLIVAIGTYRISSQDEFRTYAEYRQALATDDYTSVASTSLTHYASTVAANAVLVKHLVDTDAVELAWGSSYLTLFVSALPGEQLSLDREIKEVTGKQFIGGGTPPTLMGEGYINFGYLGAVLAPCVMLLLLRHWARRLIALADTGYADESARLATAIYGFFVAWALLSQVAGFAGASTFPLGAALLLYAIWKTSTSGVAE